MAFEENVFVNCPFDRRYLPLLRPLPFTIIYLGLKPRIALEAVDAGPARLDKIVSLIADSRYGIHDLSRIEASKAGELYRVARVPGFAAPAHAAVAGDAGRSRRQCRHSKARNLRSRQRADGHDRQRRRPDAALGHCDDVAGSMP